MYRLSLGGCCGILVSHLDCKPQPYSLGNGDQRREPWIPFGRQRTVKALPLNASLFRNLGDTAS